MDIRTKSKNLMAMDFFRKTINCSIELIKDAKDLDINNDDLIKVMQDAIEELKYE